MFKDTKNVISAGTVQIKGFGTIPLYEMKKEMRGFECPHSNSCFSCPEPDCRMSGADAMTANILPFDLQRKSLMRK